MVKKSKWKTELMPDGAIKISSFLKPLKTGLETDMDSGCILLNVNFIPNGEIPTKGFPV